MRYQHEPNTETQMTTGPSFTCTQTELLRAARVVARALPSTTAEPMLTTIVMTLEESTLKLLASDGRLVISHEIDVETIQPGRTAVPGTLLLEVLKAVQTSKSATVTVTAIEQDLSLSATDAEYKVHGMDAEDYPAIPAADEPVRMKVPGAAIKDMITKVVIVAPPNSEATQSYSEVLVEADSEGLTMVTTDSVRLSVRTEELELDDGSPEVSVLVPSRALSELARLAPDEDDVLWDLSDEILLVQCGPTRLQTLLSDKTFPNYKMIIPQTQSRSISLDTEGFIATLKGVLPVAESVKNKVYIDFNKDGIKVTSSSAGVGSAERKMDGKFEGEPVQLAFNAKYLLDFAKSIDAETFTWSFTSPTYPSTMEVGSNYTYLVMPITY